MAEFAGLGYYAEIPGVIFDIQRTGPSTGLPTRTSQADLTFVAGLSHGDTKHVMLLPGTVKECFEFGIEAFDLAEQLQTPVFVLSDLDLGMNNWMSEPFDYPEKPIARGKVLDRRTARRSSAGFARYKDVDGDGIPYRTLPGTDHPAAAYFTRGSGHNEKALYSERPDDYENNMLRLARKFETARTLVPKPILEGTGKAESRNHCLWHQPLGCDREPRPARARVISLQPTIFASALIRLRRRYTTLSPAMNASTSSSRTATRRCSIC